METSQLKAVKFSDVVTLWTGLNTYYGMMELSRRMQFELENLRETVMKFTDHIWADCPLHVKLAVETVQILTIASNINFKVQLDGEGSIDSGDMHDSAWVEAKDVYPIPKLKAPRPLRLKLHHFVRDKHLKELLMKELDLALEESKTLVGLSHALPEIAARFHAVHCLLDDIYSVAMHMD